MHDNRPVINGKVQYARRNGCFVADISDAEGNHLFVDSSIDTAEYVNSAGESVRTVENFSTLVSNVSPEFARTYNRYKQETTIADNDPWYVKAVKALEQASYPLVMLQGDLERMSHAAPQASAETPQQRVDRLEHELADAAADTRPTHSAPTPDPDEGLAWNLDAYAAAKKARAEAQTGQQAITAPEPSQAGKTGHIKGIEKNPIWQTLDGPDRERYEKSLLTLLNASLAKPDMAAPAPASPSGGLSGTTVPAVPRDTAEAQALVTKVRLASDSDVDPAARRGRAVASHQEVAPQPDHGLGGRSEKRVSAETFRC
jgi:hypothetical protein